MDSFGIAAGLLPEHLRTGLEGIKGIAPEELRLRCGKPLTVTCGTEEYPVSTPGVTAKDLSHVLEKATDASLHSAISTLKYGFLPYKGLRIGVCGKAVMKDGELVAFSSFRSLVIRIPRPFAGDLSEIASSLCGENFQNTLIVSPPGIGKTTALRELVHLISDQGCTVAVVDEREEIFPAGETDIGAHTDVLTGTDKLSGAMMLLRTMGPQVIALDEISRTEDIRAAAEIFGCGVGILATAHGTGLEDMKKRMEYRELFAMNVFRNLLKISVNGADRQYELTEITA